MKGLKRCRIKNELGRLWNGGAMNVTEDFEKPIVN